MIIALSFWLIITLPRGSFYLVIGRYHRFTQAAFGGFRNTAGGQATVVLGGLNVTDTNPNAIAPTVAP